MVSEDKGHGHDGKYSAWRRHYFKDTLEIDGLFCTDIDWIEWRKGKPVAIIECRRAIGGLKTAQAAINHVKGHNNGFQLEVLAKLAHDLKIDAYIVGIEDDANSNDYSNARFVVEKIEPPTPRPDGRLDVTKIKTVPMNPMDLNGYVKFIVDL